MISQNKDGVIIRQNVLSSREEAVKNKLIKKKNPTSDGSGAKLSNGKMNGAATKKQQNTVSEQPIMYERPVVVDNTKIDNFLNGMEDEFRQINQKQVSLGMLNTQTQLLKQQQEILNENQKQMAYLLKNVPQRNIDKPTNADEINKEIMKELIKPINNQIIEIQRIYEEVKATERKLLNSSASNSKQPSAENTRDLRENIQHFSESNRHLKDMVEDAQSNLNYLLPENMKIINSMSNLNIEAYSECISNLQRQIENLKKDADRAEKELEDKYKKLAEIPRAKEADKLAEEIMRNVNSIDYMNSRNLINRKLDGEFEYERFTDEVSDLSLKCANAIRDYKEYVDQNRIGIPTVDPEDEEILQIANLKIPSILDELKQKYSHLPPPGSINRKALGNPSDKIPASAFGNKHTSSKPSQLASIKTNPVAAAPNVRFEKTNKPDPNNYKTVFSEPAKSYSKKPEHLAEIKSSPKAKRPKEDKRGSTPEVSARKSSVSSQNSSAGKNKKFPRSPQRDFLAYQTINNIDPEKRENIEKNRNRREEALKPSVNYSPPESDHEGSALDNIVFVRQPVLIGEGGEIKRENEGGSHRNYEDLIRGLENYNDYAEDEDQRKVQSDIMRKMGMHVNENSSVNRGDKLLMEEIGTTLSKEKLVDIMKDIIVKEKKVMEKEVQYEDSGNQPRVKQEVQSNLSSGDAAQKMAENFMMLINNTLLQINQGITHNIRRQLDEELNKNKSSRSKARGKKPSEDIHEDDFQDYNQEDLEEDEKDNSEADQKLSQAQNYASSLPKVIPLHTYSFPNQIGHPQINAPFYPTNTRNINGLSFNQGGTLEPPNKYPYPLQQLQPQTMLIQPPNIKDLIKASKNRHTDSDASSSMVSDSIIGTGFKKRVMGGDHLEMSRSEGQVSLPDDKFSDYSNLHDSVDRFARRVDVSNFKSQINEQKKSTVNTKGLLDLDGSFEEEHKSLLSEGEVRFGKGSRIFDME